MVRFLIRECGVIFRGRKPMPRVSCEASSCTRTLFRCTLGRSRHSPLAVFTCLPYRGPRAASLFTFYSSSTRSKPLSRATRMRLACSVINTDSARKFPLLSFDAKQRESSRRPRAGSFVSSYGATTAVIVHAERFISAPKIAEFRLLLPQNIWLAPSDGVSQGRFLSLLVGYLGDWL